jgi:hypothetical protein
VLRKREAHGGSPLTTSGRFKTLRIDVNCTPLSSLHLRSFHCSSDPLGTKRTTNSPTQLRRFLVRFVATHIANMSSIECQATHVAAATKCITRLHIRCRN